MSTSFKKARMLKSFESARLIERRLTNMDGSKKRKTFEDEYEALLGELYGHLIDIDEMISKHFAAEKLFRGDFKMLLETGRRLDELWDQYHRHRLELAQFCRLLHRVARTSDRLPETPPADPAHLQPTTEFFPS